MTIIKNEKWKEIKINAKKQRIRYGISDAGRVCSFKEKLNDGKLLKGTLVNGYPALKLKVSDKDYQFYIHRLVAEYFLKKASEKRSYVIHHDYNKMNNKSKNLSWSSRAEMETHQKGSPNVKQYRERTRSKGHKLTAAKVKQIKQLIFRKERKKPMREIAVQFAISEMQLYRIKSGENWGHVKF